MRYIYTAITALLLGGIAAQAADYQPLVREGVRWHYNRVYGDWPMEEECVMFFEGDSIVNDVVYKKCIELQANGNRRVAALMREQDKIVYSIGGSSSVEMRDGPYNGEHILYDFQTPANMFLPNYFELELIQSTVNVAGTACNCYSYDCFNKMIEGIGLDGSGTLTDHILEVLTSDHYQYTGLSYVEQGGKIIYKGGAYEGPSTYQPLVREGVVWEYMYLNNDMTCAVERFQILGDTVITIHDSLPPYNFKKCYRYFGEHFDPDNLSPIAYMEEWGRTVSVITPPIAQHRSDEFVSDFGGTYSLPSYWGYEKTGEREIYWFENADGYLQHVNELYGCDYFSANDSVLSFVAVGDQMNRCFDITGIDIVGGKWIEGVGIDGLHTGNLIAPLAPSGETGTQGLIRLADLDGNTLYKGAYYDTYNSIDRVADDASAAADPRWYDLLGHPFDSRPTQPGVYIHQGKKVVVK